jgi:hypothetical protein
MFLRDQDNEELLPSAVRVISDQLERDDDKRVPKYTGRWLL